MKKQFLILTTVLLSGLIANQAMAEQLWCPLPDAPKPGMMTRFNPEINATQYCSPYAPFAKLYGGEENCKIMHNKLMGEYKSGLCKQDTFNQPKDKEEKATDAE